GLGRCRHRRRHRGRDSGRHDRVGPRQGGLMVTVIEPNRQVPETAGQPRTLPSLESRLMAVVVLAKVVFHLSTATVLGFHRDEFYYLAGGRHLAWGYVDHPPLTPFLYRVSETLLGDSQFALHALPALA